MKELEMHGGEVTNATHSICNGANDHDYEMVYTQRPDEHPAPVGWVCHVCDHFKPLND